MKKKFNDTGLCIPEKHYMADVSAKINAMFALVAEGSYFVINRPRQYGKTTTLYLLERKLQQQPDYFPAFISFEGFGAESYNSERNFIEAFFSKLRAVFRFYKRNDLLPLLDNHQTVATFNRFDDWISELTTTVRQRLVLMIDEVDKSSNNQLFLDFLGLLRTKYLAAAQGKETTFHSVILAGVHDVKSLKLKIRPEEERKYNSPWNIAVDFTIDLSLTPAEIQTMLQDYCAAAEVPMEPAHIADRLYYFTSGYPFLVSKLCKIIDEELRPEQGWRPEHVEEAVSRMLLLQNTNFESLIKNLENNPDLSQLVEKILFFGEQIEYNQYSHLIHLGMLYGIFIRQQNLVQIHNRIYREQIYNYLAVNLKIQALRDADFDDYNFREGFCLEDGSLNIEKVLLKFQEFMKHEYSRRDAAFIERNGRLIFLAFLKPIINGRGHDFKEPQLSEEKRLDVAVTYDRQQYIIELKVWRGDAAHQKGLRQLADYLDRAGQQTGYLIIFDFTQQGQKEWKQERIQVAQKAIFAVWV